VPNPNDPLDFLPLRLVELQILLSLSVEDHHGYGIILDTEERTRGDVRLDVATLYRALKRLERAGIVAETDARPAPAQDDARRRYYAITPLGRRVAEAEARRLAELVRAARDAELLDGVEPA
jgi:DNA-binding PadR family transcriptional regulator